MIISVYNSNIYKEYFLPNSIDMDHILQLDRDIFGLRKQIGLKIESSRTGWKIFSNEDYCFCGKEQGECLITGGVIIDIRTKYGEMLQVFGTDAPPVLPLLKKYWLKGRTEITIGAGEQNMISYCYRQLVSMSHAVIRRHSDGFYIEDLSKNGIFEDSRRIWGSKRLSFGDHINIFGLHILFLNDMLAVGTHYGELTVKENAMSEWRYADCVQERRGVKQEECYFKRSPRYLPKLHTEDVEIEAPPPPKQQKKKPLLLTIGPSFTMAVPMLLGCLLTIYSAYSTGRAMGAYMFTGIITALGSAILGVVWALMNMSHAKKEGEEEEQQRFNAYSNYLVRIAESLKKKYLQNREAMEQMYPSAGSCVSWGKDNSSLWNRNSCHADFLFCRLGEGDIPFQVNIHVPKEKFTLLNDSLLEKPGKLLEEYRILRKAPVGINLAKSRLVGLVGGRKKQGAIDLMHVLAADIAAANCYTDVKMVFIYRKEEGQSGEWECMKWFPHVWSQDKQTRYLASDEAEAGDLFFELAAVVRMRMQAEQERKGKLPKPYYVLFVSDPSLLEGELLSRYILEPEECYGMTTFLMTESVEQLPNVCEEVLQKDEYFQGHYRLMDTQENRQKIQFDHVSGRELEAMGRCLSDIVVNEEESTSEIPGSLEFLEMYGVRSLEELQVTKRWRKNRTYQSMKALIGKKAGNADCFLDIHEKYHGPHGLIAGTTGSGKSETLQTYILSMALNFSPDDVSFFVIDFKGGGMAGLFSELPHMVGQISNLSGNQVRRAMISIKSENTRRQRLFVEYGVNNINHYTRLYKDGETKIPIPHLFIVIDEFAELKREEPEFMRELISVAQVGRSLGVHLILATQKPSGTVDDNIWSNSKFRLCLRVQDRQDSNDMLHKPDAAFITQAGRCYLQVGNDEIYELFQSGWSGAPYHDESGKGQESAILLTRTGKPAVIGDYHKRRRQETNGGDSKARERTQLEAVVEYLRQTAEENGYGQPMRLWLPVLGNKIYLSELGAPVYEPNKQREQFCLEVYPGRYDDPVNQAQGPLRLSFSENGHLAVCGIVVSGKSTFLQTVVYELICRYSPKAVNLYCLDYNSKMLAAFEKAPHVGGIVFEEEPDRTGKLIRMLMRVLADRKKLLRGGNYSQYIRAHGIKLPALVVVIDNYGNFTEKTGGAYESEMLALAKEGVGYGMFLAVSGGGFSLTEIPGRIADNIRNVVTLEMGDRFKYMELLRCTKVPVCPEAGVKGRGLACVDGKILEFQTALCLEAADDFERGNRLEEFCKELGRAWDGETARPIPCIPEQPVFSQLSALPQYGEALRSQTLLPAGYLQEDASVYSIRLDRTYCYTISGKAHTGRGNALKLLIMGALQKQGKICVIEPGSRKFSKIAQENHLAYIGDYSEIFAYFKELMPVFIERNQKKHQWEDEGLEEKEIYEKMQMFPKIFVFITDLFRFCELIYKQPAGTGSMDRFLENILEKGQLHNIYFFGAVRPEDTAAASVYRSWHIFTGYRKGIHLGGNYSTQRIFSFQNISYQQLSKTLKKGEAVAADDEDDTIAVEIVLPLAKMQL